MAVALCEYNTELSAAAWVTVADIEVILRNVIADAIRALHDGVGRELDLRWYDNPSWFTGQNQWFNNTTLKQISTARHRAKDDGPGSPNRPNDGRLIAELSFGFWRFLVVSRYEHSLWNPAIRARFPGLSHLSGADARKMVHRRMEALNHLRNRIAHHEPVFHQITIPGGHSAQLGLGQILDEGIELVGWADEAAAEWIRQRSTHAAVGNRRPKT